MLVYVSITLVYAGLHWFTLVLHWFTLVLHWFTLVSTGLCWFMLTSAALRGPNRNRELIIGTGRNHPNPIFMVEALLKSIKGSF